MRKTIQFFFLAGSNFYFAPGLLPARDHVKNPGSGDYPCLQTIFAGTISLPVKTNKLLALPGSITSNPLPVDTIIVPDNVATGVPDVKVIFSNGEEGIEFSPLSSINNGALIQPVNRITKKGISTAFYLADSSDWKFYTNDQERLNINGAGNIITRSSLLINDAQPDNISALRVNGQARFDSAISLQGPEDNESFISMHRNVRSAAHDPDDQISPYTQTPISWANGRNIPVFRLRHPNVIYPGEGVNKSIQKDFMILPYQYGTAIEYNGVVECWVGEWSIHRGLSYGDIEGNGNGWGAALWVGDDGDTGGLRAIARDNTATGGNLNYAELSAERFAGQPHGDIRFRLPSNDNSFQFVYGGRGSLNVVARVSDKGFFLPKVTSVTNIIAPEKAQLVFDNTENQLKAFDGTKWVSLSDNGKTGSSKLSGNGGTLEFTIAHGLGVTPVYFNVLATSRDAANISYVTADATNLVIHYNNAPYAGTNNLSFNWLAKP